MRLNVPKATIEEELIQLINEGYTLAASLKDDYDLKAGKKINWERENILYSAKVDGWLNKVYQTLYGLFPTPREANRFKHTAPKMPIQNSSKRNLSKSVQ